MRLLLCFAIVLFVAHSCQSDSSSSEERGGARNVGRRRQQGQQPGGSGGENANGNRPRGGNRRNQQGGTRPSGTPNQRPGGTGTTDRGMGTGNTNQRGTGTSNRRGGGTGTTNREEGDTGPSNRRGAGPSSRRGTEPSNRRGTGTSNRRGGGTGTTNREEGDTGPSNRRGTDNGRETPRVSGTGNVPRRGGGGKRRQGKGHGAQGTGNRRQGEGQRGTGEGRHRGSGPAQRGSGTQQGSGRPRGGKGKQSNGPGSPRREDKDEPEEEPEDPEESEQPEDPEQREESEQSQPQDPTEQPDETGPKSTQTGMPDQVPSELEPDVDQEEGSDLGEEGANKNVDDPCDLECKSVDNPRRRVCGTDGVTYDSFCFLKAARCKDKRLEFSSRGPCPEEDDDCDMECELPENTNSLVCGTDGVTYPSSCFLEAERCNDTTLAIASAGPCPTIELTTEGYGSSTVTFMTLGSTDLTTNFEDASTAATTAVMATTPPFQVDCPDVCPLVRELVCATDGVTYQSPCVLQLVACVRNDPTLTVVSLGACTSTTPSPVNVP